MPLSFLPDHLPGINFYLHLPHLPLERLTDMQLFYIHCATIDGNFKYNCMENLLAILNAYHPISPELTEHLKKTIQYTEIKKGDYLLKEGQISIRANLVIKGLLRSFSIEGGKEYTLGFFREGEVSMNLKSFENQTPSLEYVEALEDTALFYIYRKDLDYLYAHFPEADKIGRIIFSKASNNYTTQLNKVKLLSAAERYEWFLEHNAELVLRVPSKYIASYLGITESTLSRVKAKR